MAQARMSELMKDYKKGDFRIQKKHQSSKVTTGNTNQVSIGED